MRDQPSSVARVDDPAVREALLSALAAIEEENFAAVVGAVETVLSDTPNHAVALHVLGLLAVRMNEPGRAIELLKAAHQCAPGCREHCDALAIVYAKVGNLQESLYLGKLATALAPNEDYPGLLPEWLGDFESSFMAIEDSPLIEAGEMLFKAGLPLDAAQHFRNAAEIDTKNARAWRGLALALYEANRPLEADVAFQALVTLSPDSPDDHSAMARNLTAMGAFDDARAMHAQAIELAEMRSDLYSAMLHDRRFDPVFSAGAIAEAENAWGQVFSLEPMPRPERPHETVPRKLRVGILSGRFRHEAGLDMFWSMLAHCSSSSLEVHCYSNNAYSDVVTRRIQGQVDGWVDIRAVDDETVATIMRNDRIDVLLDMEGHSEDGRPQIFTLLPAVTALRCWGLPDAANAQGFNAVLGDRTVYGEGAANTICIDGGLLPMPEVAAQRAFDRREGEAFCFGTLAARAQITSAVVDAWVQILTGSEATLLLNPDWLGGMEIATELKRSFDARGCGDKVSIHSLMKDQDADTTRYFHAVDLMLEPFPIPSMTRMFQSFQHGRPPLCLKTDLPESRIVPSLLAGLGLDDLAAATVEDYVAAGIDLARQPDRLEACRDRIAAGLAGEVEEMTPKARLTALADALVAHYRSVI